MAVKTQPPTTCSLQANPNTQRLLQVHILSPHHSPLERPPILHSCFTYCGTIQSCCVPSSTRLTVDIRSALTFNYSNPSPSLVYFFLTIHLFYSTNPTPTPTPTLHLYTEARLMSSTKVKTYRKKERKKEIKKESGRYLPSARASAIIWI